MADLPRFTPTGQPVAPELTAAEALRLAAAEIDRGQGAVGAAELHGALCATGLGAAGRFRAFAKLRLACLGSEDPGALGTWMEAHERREVAEAMRLAASHADGSW